MFISNTLPMHSSLVRKQINEAQSDYHRKTKQVQLQNFKHKERRLNIIEIYGTVSSTLIMTIKY